MRGRYRERPTEEMSLQTFLKKSVITALTQRSVAAFHAREATTGKARSPMVEERVRRTTSDDDEAE